ncbi:hypothetical protein [Pedosphaera parvula]|uniref:hypothetical protein n=1 Tax=Pedosphaera parvula TaxID=1032527 RepID=UPI00135F111C|nr:hypothetical protein [Pedosphaera parvula]
MGDKFYKLTLDDKTYLSAAIYSVYHRKQSSVNFVVLHDAYTGKNLGMYAPGYGLKLD